MLNFYKTVDNRILKIDAPEPGCWISVVSPTEAEVAYLTGDLGVEPDFVRAALALEIPYANMRGCVLDAAKARELGSVLLRVAAAALQE